jgi:hypothetical protein
MGQKGIYEKEEATFNGIFVILVAVVTVMLG